MNTKISFDKIATILSIIAILLLLTISALCKNEYVIHPVQHMIAFLVISFVVVSAVTGGHRTT